jgi:hypothetical protein
MRSSMFLAALALVGCKDNGLLIYNEPPMVIISEPVEGAVFEEGDPITFNGKISDEGPPGELEVSWTSSVAGVIEDGAKVDIDGNVQLITSALTEGEHTIVLRAYDSQAASGDATVNIQVVDVPDKPSITIVHPDSSVPERGLIDYPYTFLVSVSDYQDPPDQLTVELVANPYGVVCTMSPDGSGNAQCPGILPLGMYTLAFTVTDTDGNTAIGNTTYEVVERGDYDADGDGYSPNAGDCNDSANKIYPGADEICDGLDNDCNALTAIDVGTECYDDDGDGYCEDPPCVNTSQTLADCDDANPEKYPNPSAVEYPNGLDDDCDGIIDEGTNSYDDDGDGYCESPPCVNASGTESDCDDGRYEVNPGEDELCGDGLDNNCNGLLNEEDAIGCTEFYYDNDGDTYGVSGATSCWCDAGEYPYTGLNTKDCYDDNANAWPGQTSYFGTNRGDGKFDYNCDGSDEKQYSGKTTGCSWDFEPFSCEIDTAGWTGSVPSCGKTGVYSSDCEGEYDAVCIFFCAYSDPSLCSSCWTCDSNDATTTQSCR